MINGQTFNCRYLCQCDPGGQSNCKPVTSQTLKEVAVKYAAPIHPVKPVGKAAAKEISLINEFAQKNCKLSSLAQFYKFENGIEQEFSKFCLGNGRPVQQVFTIEATPNPNDTHPQIQKSYHIECAFSAPCVAKGKIGKIKADSIRVSNSTPDAPLEPKFVIEAEAKRKQIAAKEGIPKWYIRDSKAIKQCVETSANKDFTLKVDPNWISSSCKGQKGKNDKPEVFNVYSNRVQVDEHDYLCGYQCKCAPDGTLAGCDNLTEWPLDPDARALVPLPIKDVPPRPKAQAEAKQNVQSQPAPVANKRKPAAAPAPVSAPAPSPAPAQAPAAPAAARSGDVSAEEGFRSAKAIVDQAARKQKLRGNNSEAIKLDAKRTRAVAKDVCTYDNAKEALGSDPYEKVAKGCNDWYEKGRERGSGHNETGLTVEIKRDGYVYSCAFFAECISNTDVDINTFDLNINRGVTVSLDH